MAMLTAKSSFEIPNVTPRNLSVVLSEGKTVLLVMYSPRLPKWVNHFSALISTVAEHFAFNGSNVVVVKSNCRENPTFVRKFGIRTFPSLYLYPGGMPTAVYLPVRYHVNRTLTDYVTELSLFSEATTPISKDASDLHAQVVQFMQIQDETDKMLAWSTGAEARAAKMKLVEEAHARKYGRHRAPNATLADNSTLNGTVSGNASATEDGSAEASALSLVAGDAMPTPAAATVAVDVAADGASLPDAAAAAAALNADAELSEAGKSRAEAAALLAVQRFNEDQEMIAPMVSAVNTLLLRLEMKRAKLEYYLEVLQLISTNGNQIVASRYGSTTRELLADSEFLTAERREELVMRITVLKELLLVLA